MDHRYRRYEISHRMVTADPSFMANFLVKAIAFSVTSFLAVPTPNFLYSSVRGSMILRHSLGKKERKMMSEYPCGRWGD